VVWKVVTLWSASVRLHAVTQFGLLSTNVSVLQMRCQHYRDLCVVCLDIRTGVYWRTITTAG